MEGIKFIPRYESGDVGSLFFLKRGMTLILFSGDGYYDWMIGVFTKCTRTSMIGSLILFKNFIEIPFRALDLDGLIVAMIW